MNGTQRDETERVQHERLEAALDRFGGDLTTWPDDARAEAETLAARNASARAALADAAALEAALAGEAALLRDSPPETLSDALTARLAADAEAFALTAAPARSTRRRRGALGDALSSLGREISDFGSGLAAALAGAAAAAGLAIGAFLPVSSALEEAAAASLFDVAAIVESDFDGATEAFGLDQESGS